MYGSTGTAHGICGQSVTAFTVVSVAVFSEKENMAEWYTVWPKKKAVVQIIQTILLVNVVNGQIWTIINYS